jgi:hypothetical protein
MPKNTNPVQSGTSQENEGECIPGIGDDGLIPWICNECKASFYLR